MTKYTKHAPIIEPLLIYACAYLAYLTAEWIQVNLAFNFISHALTDKNKYLVAFSLSDIVKVIAY